MAELASFFLMRSHSSRKASRSFKLGVSLVIRAFDILFERIQHLAGGGEGGKWVVLYYHQVTKDQSNRFASQMDDLIRHAKPVSAGGNGHVEKGARSAAVTFDDGFYSVIENALPILRERGIPAAIFIPAGHLGSCPVWAQKSQSHLASEKVVTADQVRSLRNEELLTIGSHGLTHSNLIDMKEAKIVHELGESRRVLASLIGKDVDLLSFPHGAWNRRIAELARESGYERVFSITPKLVSPKKGEYVVGRVRVDPEDWPLEFRLKLLGAYRWMRHVSSAKKAILLFLRNRKA